MKITHIIFSLQVGGSESMLIDIMEEQVRLDHDVHLIIINDEMNEVLETSIPKKVKVHKFGRKEGSKSPLFIIKLYAKLYTIHSDIVHCHNVSMGKLLKFYRGKKIITIHTTDIYAPELKNFDQVVAISKAVHDDLLDTGSCQSVIIHNGIQTKNIVMKTEYRDSNSFKVLQVSRLYHETKGQDIAIKALYVLRKKNPDKDISLTFIGEGPSTSYLKNLVSDLNLDGSVNFMGKKDKAYIYQHLKDYDLLIQPSRYEGFGLTIIEGMAAKLPVVVSDIEGPMEVILNGSLGSFFECENSDDLANKIFEIMNNPNSQRVEDAYQYTIQNYSIEKTVKKYLDLYQDVIGKRA